MNLKPIIQLLYLSLMLLPIRLWASDVVEVLPLTKRIILVHYDDGWVRHNARGEQLNNEVMNNSPLNLANVRAGAFSVSSTNDGNFATARNPTTLWRKTRGTDFTHEYPGKNPATSALEHWLFLNLPYDLQEGKTYTVSWNGTSLNTTSSSGQFVFDSKATRSDAVHVNIVGFAPNAPKFAYLSYWLGDGDAVDLSAYNNQPFKLVRTSDKAEVFSGTITFRAGKTNAETQQTGESLRANFVGSDLYQCDFSAFTTPGSYVVSIPNLGCSFPFDIKADAHSEPFYWVLKSLFEQRSGIELKAANTSWPRPAPHNPNVTPGFGGWLKYSTTRGMDIVADGGGASDKAAVEAGYKGTMSTFGWYQDAGDWDGYISHLKVPAYLMMTYEANPGAWKNYNLNLPDAGSLPDLLDEARWLLRYLKRTKDELVAKGWGTGGIAGSRVFGDYWGGDSAPDGTMRGSWQDNTRDWYVLGEDPWSSYRYAGLAAQFAKILSANGLTDPEGIDWRTEAVNAYNWANTNTRSGDDTKNYDGRLKDHRLFASAALFRLTGTAAYQSQFQADLESAFNENEDQIFAAFNYLKAGGTDATTATNVLNSLNTDADNVLINSANTRGMRFGGGLGMPMLIGQATTPRIWSGIAAYLANRDRNNTAKANAYLNAISTTADYFLGGNPLNQCWVSGVGERYPTGLFHLDWFSSDNQFVGGNGGDRRLINIRKGIVPYGIWRPRDPGFSVNNYGWWSPKYAESTAYPAIPIDDAGGPNPWPGHEMFFNERITPIPAEFTIHQNHAPSALAYGLLYAVNSGSAPTPTPGPTGAVIYDDALQNGWGSYGWGSCAYNLNNTSPVRSGGKSVSVQYKAAWDGVAFNRSAGLSTSGLASLKFWAYGAPGGSKIQVLFFNAANTESGRKQITLTAGQWVEYTVNLSEVGNPAQLFQVAFQDGTGGAQPTYYLDDIRLVGSAPAGLMVYDETLAPDWSEVKWTWGGTTDLANTTNVHNGSRSARVNITGTWGALVLMKGTAFAPTDYPGGYAFWVFAPSATQLATQLYSTDQDNSSYGWKTFDVAANTWTKINVAWSEMGNPPQIRRIRIGDRNGTPAPPYTFYVDEIQLLPAGVARLSADEIASGTVRLFPNPAKSAVNVAYYAQNAQDVTLTIVDLTGRPLQQTHQSAREGINQINVPVSLTTGTYLMRVQKDGRAETVRFVVQP